MHHTRGSFESLSNVALLLPAIRLYKAICKTQPVRPAVGVCLEGDTTLRLEGTAALYHAGRINRVIVSGGVKEDNRSDQLPASLMKQYLTDLRVPAEVILIEGQSQVTDDHPVFVNPIAKEHRFTELVIITSGYHVLRAYLRFLKVLLAQGRPYTLYGYPVATGKAWFEKSTSEGRYRISNFYDELTKIRTYPHLASFSEAWDYIRSLRPASRQLARD